jgi:hypothetical protein
VSEGNGPAGPEDPDEPGRPPDPDGTGARPDPDELPPLVVTDDPNDRGDRLRPLRRTLLVGGLLAVVGAVAVGVLGGGGAGSLAALFVGLALVAGTGSVVTLLGAFRDELRGRRVPRGRIVLGVALLFAAPFLLVLAAGAAGAA